MTAPSALPGLDAIRSAPDGYGDDGAAVWAITAPQRDALVAAVEAAAEVEASAEPYYVVGRGGHGKWAVRVNKAALVHLRTALAAFAEVPAPPVSHTDAVWQEGDDGGDGGLTLQAMQSAVRAAGLASAHLGDEVWGGDGG